MNDSGGLYRLNPELPEVPRGLQLVAGLTGFTDAGGAVSQLAAHFEENLESVTVATFDADALLDYRARRPVVFFDEDHLTSYRPPELSLRLVYDELERPFLFLSGFEPDFRWEGFSAAVMSLIDRFEVEGTVWVHAIPMPVPHTRPIGVTVSGNRPDLAGSMSVWRPRTQAPATALHLLEYRLSDIGRSTVGFVLLVPHYLADTEYPAAAVAALDSIGAATGLLLPTERLRDDDRAFVANIDEQVSANPELARLVGTLEQRHDSYMQETPLRQPLSEGPLPTADEIASELEDFLAGRRNGDDDGTR